MVDVARRSGVSVATVSNVLHRTAPVSEATRRRVLEAIDELGYRQNEVARSLKRRATQHAGRRHPRRPEPVPRDRRAAGRAARPPRRLRRAPGRDRERSRDRVRPGARARRPPRRRRHLPRRDRGLDHPVGAARPRRAGGRGLVRGPRPAPRHRPRRRVRGHGGRSSATSPASATSGSPSPTRARTRSRSTAAPPRSPTPSPGAACEPVPAADGATAVCCTNDVIAMALIDRLEGEGVRVPEDVSVVGFDDIPHGRPQPHRPDRPCTSPPRRWGGSRPRCCCRRSRRASTPPGA